MVSVGKKRLKIRDRGNGQGSKFPETQENLGSKAQVKGLTLTRGKASSFSEAGAKEGKKWGIMKKDFDVWSRKEKGIFTG